MAHSKETMINQLIERTNRTSFYSTGRILLAKLSGNVKPFNAMEFNFIVDEQNEYGDFIDVEYWKIVANRMVGFKGIFTETYLPYIKLKLLQDHPLLWTYNKNELECKLIGHPDNLSEFIGDLSLEFEKVAGNWISLHQHFWNLDTFYKDNRSLSLFLSEPLGESVRKVCNKHNIEFQIENVIEGKKKGFFNRPDVNLLLFGNEDVSPNDFNLKQPYIIADEFIATKTTKEV